ncbi:radical SAM protein [Candidatus Gracilibacteria bacterium]|nr:radical SAM protein [Candidatus Gracilibacteria bacterium]
MKFVLQWHITEKCNFRCTHCYQDEYTHGGLPLHQLKKIFHQIFDIQKNYFGQAFTKRHINFIGGEPFLRSDFIEFLEYINDHTPQHLYIGILTNGSLISSDILHRLQGLENLTIHFQISIEGTQQVNDSIRGIGSYVSIIRAIKLSSEHGFKVHASLTLTRLNEASVFDLIPFIERYDIRLKIRRLVPTGIGEQLDHYLLTPKQWYGFSIKVFKVNRLLKAGKMSLSGCSEVTSYQYSGEGCAINLHRLLVINANGEVVPCKRLEKKIGNALETPLVELFNDPIYLQLLGVHKDIEICQKCNHKDSCRGGAKCITYALENKQLNSPDPQCYTAELIRNTMNNDSSS